MSEVSRTILFACLSVSAGFAWQGFRAADPGDLAGAAGGGTRLAQLAALLLAATASAYFGFAVTHENQPGAGLDVALAMGFCLVAASTLVLDPRQALTIIALAFAAHAVLDVAHRPGALPDGVAPRWYALGCALFNIYIGAVAYWPILRR